LRKNSSALFRTLSTINYIALKLVRPSSTQTRVQLGDIDELTESIKKNGLLQPIVVRPKGSQFEVVAGNRRLAACNRLRISRVLCVLKELSDKEAYEIALVENLHRKTLDPIEEARAFKNYCDKYGYGSRTELAYRIGKSEEYVSHRILLLTLPESIVRYVSSRELSPTLAEELVWVKNRRRQLVLADAAMSDGLSAKEVRALARHTRSQLTDRMKAQAGGLIQGGDFEYRETRDDDARIITEAILILRSALVHFDSLIERGVSGPLRGALIAKRYSLHQLLDELFILRSGRLRAIKAMAR